MTADRLQQHPAASRYRAAGAPAEALLASGVPEDDLGTCTAVSACLTCLRLMTVCCLADDAAKMLAMLYIGRGSSTNCVLPAGISRAVDLHCKRSEQRGLVFVN